MNTYEIVLKRYEHKNIICAETSGKAKYQLYLQLDEFVESFEDFLHWIESCRYLRKSKKEDYFRKDFDLKRTATYRGVPLADYGTEVELRGRRGFIVGSNSSCNFDIKFEDEIFNCHPNYKLVYFDKNGKIIYDFRKEE